MKYFLSFFTFLLVSFSFVFSNANAWIFTSNESDIPYCQWNECTIDNWLNAVRDIDWIESERTLSVYVQDIIKYVLWFLALIATIIIIYSWFNLLTWIGDEEKAKTSKTIIIYAIIWLVIIFLAWPIIDFVLKVLNS